MLVAQEARTEVISPDTLAVDSDELRLLDDGGRALLADKTNKLAAVVARSGLRQTATLLARH